MSPSTTSSWYTSACASAGGALASHERPSALIQTRLGLALCAQEPSAINPDRKPATRRFWTPPSFGTHGSAPCGKGISLTTHPACSAVVIGVAATDDASADSTTEAATVGLGAAVGLAEQPTVAIASVHRTMHRVAR